MAELLLAFQGDESSPWHLVSPAPRAAEVLVWISLQEVHRRVLGLRPRGALDKLA